MPQRKLMAVLTIQLLVAQHGNAQQTDSTLIELDAVIAASPTRVFDVLVKEIGTWWHPDHTYSGDAGNLTLAAVPGGCFCEALPGGGGVEHLRVIHSAPGQMLRLSGGLGPLQSGAVSGTLTLALSREAEGTAVHLSYSLSGYYPGGLTAVAPAVESVLQQQLQRLQQFTETGRPDGSEVSRP